MGHLILSLNSSQTRQPGMSLMGNAPLCRGLLTHLPHQELPGLEVQLELQQTTRSVN